MSGSEQYERVSVSSDGVTVDKRFEEDEFPVPAIAFEIRSSRSEAVRVVLVDRVPEDVAVEDLGFHPEYGSEYWTIDANHITFEREIEPNAEYTTVYGIRATGTDDVGKFLGEPTLEEVDPPLDAAGDAVVDGQSSDVVRDVISGESDAIPGLEDDDEDVETLDLADPTDPGGSDDAATVGAGSGGESVDSLVGAMAAELRSGNVDEEDVRLLRKAFDVVDDDSGSVDARIERLQTEVADLAAYTDALEEFLDENGTAEQTIEEFRADVEAVRSTVDDVESSMEALESEMNVALEEVDGVRDDVDAVETDVDDLERTVAEVESTVADVESAVDDVASELEDLDSRVSDVDVATVEADLRDVKEEIADLKDWREQLSTVIGGGN